MITEKVQNLFDFIDWLHSEADYLLSQQHLVDEVDDIRAEQNKLSPTKHFKDKAEYDRLQHLFLEKLSVIEANIIAPIKEKIEFYDIADIRTPIVNLNALGDLLELQRNYNEQDLLKIQKAKNQYIIYRIKTHWQPYFSFQSFFFELDRELYEYFKFFEEENEVEYISNKPVKVGLEELAQLATGKAVYQNINFSSFTDFLEHYKKEVQDLVLEPGAKRVVDRYKAKFETATFQSEIDEVEQFAEKSVKELKGRLFNIFNGESYKTKVIGSAPRFYHLVKCLDEYEKMYAAALSVQHNKTKGTIEDSAEPRPVKFTANEYALAYIFDLWASGEQIPTNRIEGGLNKIEIMKIGENMNNITADSFYRAVLKLSKLDLNKQIELKGISNDWHNAVQVLSKNWEITKQYLLKKELLRE